jgi:hypothetical protein
LSLDGLVVHRTFNAPGTYIFGLLVYDNSGGMTIEQNSVTIS